jgi:hypothetical protein
MQCLKDRRPNKGKGSPPYQHKVEPMIQDQNGKLTLKNRIIKGDQENQTRIKHPKEITQKRISSVSITVKWATRSMSTRRKSMISNVLLENQKTPWEIQKTNVPATVCGSSAGY